MSTFTIFLALIIIVAFLLIIVIMVQNPKGGGLPSSFGGGAGQFGGVQNTTDFLDKSTWTLATLLLALILLSNVTIMDGNGPGESKIMNGEDVEMNVPAPINTTPTQEQDTSN